MGRQEVPGGFLFPAERTPGRVFVLTGSWDDRYAVVLERDDVAGIRLSKSAGWHDEDVSFVAGLPRLRSVEIYSWGVKDVSAIEAHPELEHIGLECQFRRVDFSGFARLASLGLRWRPGAETAFACHGLEYCNLDGFPDADLAPMSGLGRLSRLVLTGRKLESLRGAQALSALRVLELERCSALVDLSALAVLGELEELAITASKKLASLDPLGGLGRLRALKLEGCGAVDSVAPLERCTALESLLLVGTTVADGDLAPLLRLPALREVRIARHRGHSHSADELNAELRSRGR